MIKCALLLVVVLLSVSFADAQTVNVQTKSARPANAGSESAGPVETDADTVAAVRRANAVSLLLSLATEARAFRDQMLRARVLAQIADILWNDDQERARELFRRAWDAAEVADQEGQKKVQDEIQRQRQITGGAVVYDTPPNLRAEVVGLAALRDRMLGEEFLARLKSDQAKAAAEQTNVRSNSFSLSEATQQRLNLAQQLLDTDVEKAVQFADPALGVPSIAAIQFLSSLRDQNAAAADQRFASMLTYAETDVQADANTVSLLASYIVTPHVFVIFNPNGGMSSSQMGNAPPPNVSPELRARFLTVAAEILTRPAPSLDQDQTSSGPLGKYLLITRLMPFFDQYAPKELTDAMHAQLDSLSQVLGDKASQQTDEMARRGLTPAKKDQDQDQERSFLERIDHAGTSAQRDLLYVQLAVYVLRKNDPRARDFAFRIEDQETRKSARAFIDASLSINAVEKKDVDHALEFLRTGQLTHLQRVWVLTQAAKLLAKTERPRSISLTDEAAAAARRIDGGDADRPRALMAVANALLEVDRERAWEAMAEAVKAANAAEGYTGQDGSLFVTLRVKGYGAGSGHKGNDFEVAGIMSVLAKDNYDKAIGLAESFQQETPRARAIMAIATSVLKDDKPSAHKSGKPAGTN